MIHVDLLVTFHQFIGLKNVLDDELNLLDVQRFVNNALLRFLFVGSEFVFAKEFQKVRAAFLFVHFPQRDDVTLGEAFTADVVDFLKELKKILEST